MHTKNKQCVFQAAQMGKDIFVEFEGALKGKKKKKDI